MSSSVLELASAGNASQVLRDMRVRSIYSPYYFAKTVLGYHKLVSHLHQHDMELFVQRWAAGHTKQFIEWPRAFFKTTTFTISMGIWVTLPVTDEDSRYALDILNLPEDQWWARVGLHDQDATQLYAFEVIENAKKKVTEIKWHFEENELFRATFPEIAYTGSERPWNNECLRLRRIGERSRAPEGTFEAIGVGGALQSRHYKIVWEDDLVGEKARKSPAVMEQTIGWHQRLNGAFENATTQIRFGVSNRWGYADLNSHIRKNEPDFIFYTRAAWEIGSEGQEIPIFPEEYSMDKLLEIQNSMTKYDFSCQYLNSPTLPGEKEVDAGKLHYYIVAEDGRMECSCGKSFYLSQLNRYLHYDPYNAKGTSSTSCPAIVVVACSSDKHVFLIDYFLGKENYGNIYERIFHFNDAFRPQLMTYEDVGHQNMTEYHIKAIEKTPDYMEKHRRFPRIIGVKTGNRSKENRIREGLFPVIEKKKFSIRSKQVVFVSMLETFPHRVLDHDYDLLDALTQGAPLWRYPESEDAILDQRAHEDIYLAQLGKPYSVGVRI